VPVYAPPSDYFLCGFGDSISIGGGSGSARFAWINTSGHCYIRWGTNSYTVLLNFITIHGGTTGAFALTFDGAGNAAVYFAGILLLSTAVTGSFSPTHFHVLRSYNVKATSTGIPWLIAGAFTASEILTQAQTGRLPSWCNFPGSTVNLRNGLSFQSGASGPDTLTVSGLSITSCITTTPTDYVVTSAAFNTVAGRKYRIRVPSFVLNSGSYPQLRVGTSTNLTTATGTSGGQSWDSYAGEEWLEFTAGGNGSNLRLGFRIPSATDFSCGTVEMCDCGPMAKLVITAGRILPDLSGNMLHGVLSLGAMVVSDSVEGNVPQTALTANGELIGTAGTAPIDATIILVTLRNTTANDVTGFALGSTSGGYELTPRTDIPANSTRVLALTIPYMADLTQGSYTGGLGVAYGRVYYSATTWNSGSLNVSIRYRRERGI